MGTVVALVQSSLSRKSKPCVVGLIALGEKKQIARSERACNPVRCAIGSTKPGNRSAPD